MTIPDQTMATLTAKVDAFALTLSAPEQVLLAELVSADDDVVGFGGRPIWPGLVTLRPELEVPEAPGLSTRPDGFADVGLGGTNI